MTKSFDASWDHFTRGQKSGQNHYSATCSHCGKGFKYGKTNLLRGHLAHHCPDIDKRVKTEFLKTIASGNNGSYEEDVNCSSDTLSLLSKRHKVTQMTLTGFIDTPLLPYETEEINRSLLRCIVLCNLPYSIVDHPFFMDYSRRLRPMYTLPSASYLSDELLWSELARIELINDEKLSRATNLTLAVDGWTNLRSESIYCFVIITGNREAILHSASDLSDKKHTGDYLASEMERVIKKVGEGKFIAVITDNAANMRSARNLICANFPWILNLRCAAHAFNLIICDILNFPSVRKILKDAVSIISQFTGSHLLQNALKTARDLFNITIGLRNPVKTRWSSVYDCVHSLLLNEGALKKVISDLSAEVNPQVKSIVQNYGFWSALVKIETITYPFKQAITIIEADTATLAEVYYLMIMLASRVYRMKDPDVDFRLHCIQVFNHRWEDMYDPIFHLAYFLHPRFRGRGMVHGQFNEMMRTAGEIWRYFEKDEQSVIDLLGQMQQYKLSCPPYDAPFNLKMNAPILWWSAIEDVMGNNLSRLAIRLLSIAPHSANCERVFSLMSWYHSKRRNRLTVERVEAMARLHNYYVQHPRTELKHGFDDICPEDVIRLRIITALTEKITDEADITELFEDLETDEATKNADIPQNNLVIGSMVDLSNPIFNEEIVTDEPRTTQLIGSKDAATYDLDEIIQRFA